NFDLRRFVRARPSRRALSALSEPFVSHGDLQHFASSNRGRHGCSDRAGFLCAFAPIGLVVGSLHEIPPRLTLHKREEDQSVPYRSEFAMESRPMVRLHTKDRMKRKRRVLS